MTTIMPEQNVWDAGLAAGARIALGEQAEPDYTVVPYTRYRDALRIGRERLADAALWDIERARWASWIAETCPSTQTTHTAIEVVGQANGRKLTLALTRKDDTLSGNSRFWWILNIDGRLFDEYHQDIYHDKLGSMAYAAKLVVRRLQILADLVAVRALKAGYPYDVQDTAAFEAAVDSAVSQYTEEQIEALMSCFGPTRDEPDGIGYVSAGCDLDTLAAAIYTHNWGGR